MKTQYYSATTIDGFIADENNSLDWLFEVDQGGVDPFTGFFTGVGAMAMGSTTYEWIIAHDDALAHPEKWHEPYGDTPTWIFTHRDLPVIPGANLHFVQGDVAPVHRDMTAAAKDKNVWIIGGGELAGQFADQDLLDEIILGVTPVTLGRGSPVLPRRLTSSRLTLIDARPVGQFAYLTYTLAKSS
ncbi:dihydrofolate reductase family protein [Actinoplanes aureus]|uniref:Dihydrofolate reductase n=1 Tax=Actinoplanes aureus TaxID=2792083 RepID=A0A931G4J1_9ACTN|nr:dihydrofolate reductase family protein [Actinoplanes aureus]MBG0565334.1 dihydrofolate reductase [Actinoplanes aureus]